MTTGFNLDVASVLEHEAIYVIREAAAQFENVAILFSGGKDSIVLAALACKAFAPAPPPFFLLHIDTGHNFPETLEFRDRFARDFGFPLKVRRVQDTIDSRGLIEELGPDASRNALQTTTLLDAIRELQLDAVLGGARRDEEKSRAKERFFSHRTADGRWHPRHQRPELWQLYNGRKRVGENFRIFPLSNWTEMDVWRYIKLEALPIPALYFSHERDVFQRRGIWLPASDLLVPAAGECLVRRRVRFRTVGDMTCTGAVQSNAGSLDEILAELEAARETERGTRYDDQRSDTAMEDRKLAGYF